MNKEFIPYEQALELKELGFKGWCLGLYPREQNEEFAPTLGYVSGISAEVRFEQSEFQTLAPLYQQVFRWFREKHGLNYHIKSENNDWEWVAGNYWGYVGKNMATYEEVQLGCLNKLIDIIQIDKSGEWFAKNADIKIEIAKNI